MASEKLFNGLVAYRCIRLVIVVHGDISIFERSEVVKDDGGPYTVFTPYGRKWRARFTPDMVRAFPSTEHLDQLWRTAPLPSPTLQDLGFQPTDLVEPAIEVEDVLYSHPAVMTAAVVARPDEKWGEVPAAYIEVKEDAKVTVDDIIAHCREHLARFKVPKHVEFCVLPKTSTGKIQKFVLRQQAKSSSAIE